MKSLEETHTHTHKMTGWQIRRLIEVGPHGTIQPHAWLLSLSPNASSPPTPLFPFLLLFPSHLVHLFLYISKLYSFKFKILFKYNVFSFQNLILLTKISHIHASLLAYIVLQFNWKLNYIISLCLELMILI